MTKKLISLFILITFLAFPSAGSAALPQYYGSLQAPQVLSQIQFTDVANHWAKGPILKMAALGIIRGVGGNRFNPNGVLTKEQALILILRSMGLGELAESKAEELAAATGQKPENATGFTIRGYIETAVEEEILSEGEAAVLLANRTKPAERQEVAYWTSKALGLSPVYGTAQKLIHGFNDAGRFDARYLAAIEALLQEKIMSGTSQTTFSPQGNMKRGEMAALLDRIYPRLAERQKLVIDTGIVTGEGSQQVGAYRQKLLEIRTDDLQVFNLVTGASPAGQRDVIVYKNGSLGNSSLLKVGDRITFTFNSAQEVEFIEAVPAADQLVFGQIASIDHTGKTVVVTDNFGTSRVISLPASPTVIIDNRPATVNDLVIGQDVELTIKNGIVQRINGTFGAELVGYTPPRRGVQTGWIKSITSDELILANDNGRQETYPLHSGVWVSKSGKWQTVRNLQIGDRVKIHLSDKGTGEIDRIEISSFAGQVVRVIQGRLENVYPDGKLIALENVKELENGHWYKAEGFDFVNLAPDAHLYARGRSLTPSELAQHFIGETVYLAFTSSFGTHEGIKLVVKEGEPLTFSDTIHSITWAGYEVELKKENETLQLNPGTIVTKNNRLIEPEDLAEDEQVILVANRGEDAINSIIVVSNTYYPNDLEVYQGRIDEVEEREFELVYYTVLDGNAWDNPSTRRRGKDLEFDNNTIIIDTSESDPQEISPDKFAESRWSGYYSKSFYAFAVTKDDKVLSMTLWREWDLGDYPDELKTTLGRVTEVDSFKGELTLERVVDWSETYKEWVRNDFPLELKVNNALIYREDQAITVDHLKVGDKLYLIHDQYQGFVIFVQ